MTSWDNPSETALGMAVEAMPKAVDTLIQIMSDEIQPTRDRVTAAQILLQFALTPLQEQEDETD